MNEHDAAYKAAVSRYVVGGIGALGWTIFIYVIVVNGFTSNMTLLSATILVAAAAQLAVQAYYFLDLSNREQDRPRYVTFVFTIAMMLIVVIGSLWVMYNLNYHMNMPPEQMQQYMIEQNKKGF